jgi:hypothetical protein
MTDLTRWADSPTLQSVDWRGTPPPARWFTLFTRTGYWQVREATTCAEAILLGVASSGITRDHDQRVDLCRRLDRIHTQLVATWAQWPDMPGRDHLLTQPVGTTIGMPAAAVDVWCAFMDDSQRRTFLSILNADGFHAAVTDWSTRWAVGDPRSRSREDIGRDRIEEAALLRMEHDTEGAF